jgi:hypothetical protein
VSLEEVFYLMAIIFMSVMFVVLIALVVAVFVIKHKINLIHRQIEEKLHVVTSILHTGTDIVDRVKNVIKR